MMQKREVETMEATMRNWVKAEKTEVRQFLWQFLHPHIYNLFKYFNLILIRFPYKNWSQNGSKVEREST